MIYSNFAGRVAKKAKLIDGVNGQFLSMDMAVNDYSKGEEVTQWVRVQSSDPAHLKRVHAKTIDFLNIGKKQDGTNAAANAATDSNVPDVPTDTPKEKKDDLPF